MLSFRQGQEDDSPVSKKTEKAMERGHLMEEIKIMDQSTVHNNNNHDDSHIFSGERYQQRVASGGDTAVSTTNNKVSFRQS